MTVRIARIGKTYPIIEDKELKHPRRLCKDCTPAEWIECYQRGQKWEPCAKRKAQK